jgi:hypothetical protein
MNKPMKTTCRSEGQLKPFTRDLRQAVLDGFTAVGSDGKGKDCLQGYLTKMGRENPELAERARPYARYFDNSEYLQ